MLTETPLHLWVRLPRSVPFVLVAVAETLILLDPNESRASKASTPIERQCAIAQYSPGSWQSADL
jgi:hypothetical protein